MNVLIVEPGKHPRRADIPDGLTSMQEVVGGLIEAVYPFDDPVALICNEEGKLDGLKPNRALRYPDTGEICDVICGTFFLCSAPSDSDSFESLPEPLLVKYESLFQAPEYFLQWNGQLICLQAEEEQA